MRQLSLAPYGAEVFMATDARSWRALRRKLSFLDEDCPVAAGRSEFASFHPKEGGLPTPVCVIYIDIEQHGGNVSELVNTCAHEAAHAASQLFDHIGYYPHGAEEPGAYLVGALTQWLYEGVTEG